MAGIPTVAYRHAERLSMPAQHDRAAPAQPLPRRGGLGEDETRRCTSVSLTLSPAVCASCRAWSASLNTARTHRTSGPTSQLGAAWGERGNERARSERIWID